MAFFLFFPSSSSFKAIQMQLFQWLRTMIPVAMILIGKIEALFLFVCDSFATKHTNKRCFLSDLQTLCSAAMLIFILLCLSHCATLFLTFIQCFLSGRHLCFCCSRTFHFCKKSPSSVKFTMILFGKKVGLCWRGRNGIHQSPPPLKKKQHFSHLLAPLLQGNYTHTRGWLSQIPERLKRVPLNCCRSRSTWIKVGWTRTAQSTPCCISFEVSEHRNKCDIEERLCWITWNIIPLCFFFCQRSSEVFFLPSGIVSNLRVDLITVIN